MRYVLLLLLLTTPVLADEWVEVATSQAGHVFQLKSGSLQYDDEIAVALGQVIQNDNQVRLYHWAVSAQDCEQEYGSLLMANLQGTDAQKVSFSYSGESAASAIGEFLCRAYKEVR